jgi:adenylate kinase family enzyme
MGAEREPKEVGRRISVVGTCGAGKTTVARALAERLGFVDVELDALSWGPDWTMRPDAVFRADVATAAAGDRWVIDGNYSKVRDIVWAHADTVVWLDYSFPRVFTRLLWRTLRRALTRGELWHGNRESLRTSFLSRNSILLWAIKTHRRRGREYSELLARPENKHLIVVRLCCPREATRWLDDVRSR